MLAIQLEGKPVDGQLFVASWAARGTGLHVEYVNASNVIHTFCNVPHPQLLYLWQGRVGDAEGTDHLLHPKWVTALSQPEIAQTAALRSLCRRQGNCRRVCALGLLHGLCLGICNLACSGTFERECLGTAWLCRWSCRRGGCWHEALNPSKPFALCGPVLLLAPNAVVLPNAQRGTKCE